VLLKLTEDYRHSTENPNLHVAKAVNDLFEVLKMHLSKSGNVAGSFIRVGANSPTYKY